MGLISAFILPAREAMMADVIGPAGRSFLQRAVTTTVAVTFIAQISGMFLARFAATLGAAPIMLIQAAIQLFGAFTAARLTPSTRHTDHGQENGGSQFARIADGLREVANSYALLPINHHYRCDRHSVHRMPFW